MSGEKECVCAKIITKKRKIVSVSAQVEQHRKEKWCTRCTECPWVLDGSITNNNHEVIFWDNEVHKSIA